MKHMSLAMTNSLRLKGMEKDILRASRTRKHTCMAILILDKVDFKSKLEEMKKYFTLTNRTTIKKIPKLYMLRTSIIYIKKTPLM